MDDNKITCPWCGGLMEPICEEKKLLINLLRKRTFYNVALRCIECGAQGPEISLAANQDMGLEAAIRAARRPRAAWEPYDRECIAQPEKMEALGIEEAKELAHIWHEARHGRVSVWPVKPGEIYYKVQARGLAMYDDEDKYIGQRIKIDLTQRIFMAGQSWGANCFRTKEEAMAEADRRWPGIQLEPESVRSDVTTLAGTEVRRAVETGDMHGETTATDEHAGKLTREDIEGPKDNNDEGAE